MLRFHVSKQRCYPVTSHKLLACEKFGVLSNFYRSRSLYCERTGRPVRVRRQTSDARNFGIRNSRAHGRLMYTFYLFPSGEGASGKMSLGPGVSLGSLY